VDDHLHLVQGYVWQHLRKGERKGGRQGERDEKGVGEEER